MKKYQILFGILVAVVVLFFWRSGGKWFNRTQSGTPEKAIHEEKKDIDHVFLIIIDTLRADHLGCYGYPRNTSPFIDSLAEKGVVFEKAYSQSASTGPSHASIFTGLYLYQHRVISNYYVLDESYTTLAELLRNNGITTAAFTSIDMLFSPSKIDQGFIIHEEPPDTRQIYGFKYRPAEFTIDKAIAWFDKSGTSQKTFTWIHLFDPHFPYHPPKKYLNKIDKSLEKKSFLDYLKQLYINAETFNEKTLNAEYENLNNVQKMYEYISNYDAEIAYADNELKRFYDFVEEKGFNKNSLWIITGDHGEGLGQHSWLGHAFMIYQEEIHVPLIFFSDKNIQPARIEDVVENLDIFSTVLEILDIKPDKRLSRKIKSVSLLKQLLTKEKSPVKKHAFCEREYKLKGKKLVVMRGDKEKISLQDKSFKYIYRSDNEDEFYNLQEDPFEQINLVSMSQNKHAEEMKILKKKLSEILEDKKQYDSIGTNIVDKNTIKKLKSLGYMR